MLPSARSHQRLGVAALVFASLIFLYTYRANLDPYVPDAFREPGNYRPQSSWKPGAVNRTAPSRYAWREGWFKTKLPESQLALLDRLAYHPQESWRDDTTDYKWVVNARLTQLAACLASGRCHKNADKIIVFNHNYCYWGFGNKDPIPGGEEVYCKAMRESFERSGFTVLNAGPEDFYFLQEIYDRVGENIVLILTGNPDNPQPKFGKLDNVIKTAQRPRGIPAWKLFYFTFWADGVETPTGPFSWCMLAESGVPRNVTVSLSRGKAIVHTEFDDLKVWTTDGDMPGAPARVGWPAAREGTYVGFGDGVPTDWEVVPWEKRPNRVYILAKTARYFKDSWFPLEYFERAYAELKGEFPGLEFVGGWLTTGADAYDKVPKFFKNLGPLKPDAFDEQLKLAKVLVGIGNPKTSPTPYRSLAMAVPFLNPHQIHQHNAALWVPQHDTMQAVPPPYVYNVDVKVYAEFVNALRKALKTPIEETRFARNQPDVYDKRLSDFALRDWGAEAKHAQKHGLGVKKTFVY
ncbi:hypothetical protein Q8F55_002978 [Vanrija albida]|uniref:Alpha-1,6-mannosyl-glycoprotein 6-beta-N-acetylglucosaminyltransferase n=1 Tax=Vanrija albida TaxID=181172 RepID=A0ABR3QB79_9TREE